MGRPRLKDIDTATPERILDAAMNNFAQAGFDGARLGDIAAEAGITRPSLLYHFDSKAALYAAVVRRTFLQLGESLFSALSQHGDFRTRIERTARAYARFLDAQPALAPMLVRELLDRRGPTAQLLAAEVVPLLDRVVELITCEGAGILRPGFPVRAAILQLASDLLLRSAAGPLREVLWGTTDQTSALLGALFFVER